MENFDLVDFGLMAYLITKEKDSLNKTIIETQSRTPDFDITFMFNQLERLDKMLVKIQNRCTQIIIKP